MMVKFQRLIIMAVILLGCNFKANAELVVEPNGRVRVSTGGFNQNGVRTWRYLDNGRGGMGGNMFYHETSSKSLAVREASTGLRSASTVPVTIEQKVSRSTVLKNLLSKAKAGGKFARVGGGPVGFVVSTAAFYLVEQMLADEGYKYDVTLGDFVTDKEYVIIITPNDERNGGKNEFELARFGLSKDSYDYGYKSYKSTLDGLCDRASKNVDDYAKSKGDEGHIAKEYKGSTLTGGCKAITAYGEAIKAFWRIEPNKKQPISQSEFDRIVGPNADRNPTSYVNATANEDGSIPGASVSTPTVPNGTVITLGPATGQDGRLFQITISFTTTSDGNTTATVTTAPRPNLTPGSPAAPKTNPTPTPGENGKPGSQPDPNPDGKPKEDDKPKESGGLLCEVFPNILACAEKGNIEEQEEPFKIPHTQNETTFRPDFFLPDNGVCPAPRTATYLGITLEFKYDLICRFAEMIRFLVIGIAAVVAAFIMFSSRKD
ncbi:IgG-binding virulence factor TspB family protein [Neisseria iguanae]|uniref:IgG-binding virulence factor TspB family protein n=1 Tax=Neisseria iguanae TaxID=90242 RepID=UPI0011B1E696|nr:IgG-binding virulence factor TspB family protein [Neisseria iguanae]